MNEIQFVPGDKGHNAFVIEESGERVAEMIVGISANEMSVYHTEVTDTLEGQSVGRKLIDEMTEYARTHHLKVIPLCSYVHAHFKKHPEQYADIWKREAAKV